MSEEVNKEENNKKSNWFKQSSVELHQFQNPTNEEMRKNRQNGSDLPKSSHSFQTKPSSLFNDPSNNNNNSNKISVQDSNNTKQTTLYSIYDLTVCFIFSNV